MGQLNAHQAHDLANDFLAMATTVGDYRYREISSLSEGENQELKEVHQALLDIADELYTRSANLVMDEVVASLNQINSITARMEDTFRNIVDVQKAIDRATQLVNLGTALLKRDPLAIKDSLTTILTTEDA